MIIRENGRNFNIPEKTLRRKLVSKDCGKHQLGPSSCLGGEVETELDLHIENLQAAGFAPSWKTVQKLAFDVTNHFGVKTKLNSGKLSGGRDWCRSFMGRNPRLSLRKAEGISVARAQGMNREDVNKYFDLLTTTLNETGLIGKPPNIYNVDKTGLQLNNKVDKVVDVKGSKDVHVLTSGEKGERVSLIVCSNAEGNFLRPYCILKGMNRKPEFSDGMSPGSVAAMNKKSAYGTSEIFMDWLENHFTPQKPSDKTLLILNGHSFHMNCYKTMEFAMKNDIVLLCLPSHSTHHLQPLDRSFFKPIEMYFHQACQNWILINEKRKITRVKFGKLFCHAWSRAATTATGAAGFSATGIFLLERDQQFQNMHLCCQKVLHVSIVHMRLNIDLQVLSRPGLLLQTIMCNRLWKAMITLTHLPPLTRSFNKYRPYHSYQKQHIPREIKQQQCLPIPISLKRRKEKHFLAIIK
jgi:hypothetical protein